MDITAVRREDVNFHFANENEVSDLTGTLLVRPGQMVLHIPGGYGPYHIVGNAVGNHFEGTSDVEGWSEHTTARWADVGDGLFVGVWVEDNEEFLFSFYFKP
jgi:hypothetical protein